MEEIRHNVRCEFEHLVGGEFDFIGVRATAAIVVAVALSIVAFGGGGGGVVVIIVVAAH